MTKNKIDIGKRTCESQYIANTYGFVRTNAHYYNIDNANKNSIQQGNSEVSLVTNKSIRRLFHNAIINGGIKHNAKINHVKKAYEDFKKWNYQLLSWTIIYTTSQKIRIQHNEYSNKTYVLTESTKKTGYDIKSRAYQNDAFNAKRQKSIISRKQNKIIEEHNPDNDNDKYIGSKKRY